MRSQVHLWRETTPDMRTSLIRDLEARSAQRSFRGFGAGDGVDSFGITIANGMGWDILREFWPDVRRGFKKRSSPCSPVEQPTSRFGLAPLLDQVVAGWVI